MRLNLFTVIALYLYDSMTVATFSFYPEKVNNRKFRGIDWSDLKIEICRVGVSRSEALCGKAAAEYSVLMT